MQLRGGTGARGGGKGRGRGTVETSGRKITGKFGADAATGSCHDGPRTGPMEARDAARSTVRRQAHEPPQTAQRDVADDESTGDNSGIDGAVERR